jgi:DNA-binding transcriptional ArsR family regulator
MSYILLDHFFSTLSNPRRVRILQLLDKEGPKNVSEIVSALQVEQSAVSHCLKKLLECHFVHVNQIGKERVYSLNKETMEPLLRQIEKHVEHYCVENCEHN